MIKMSVEILRDMSVKYGSDEDYVLAGGGNTSYKENGVMYVKSSGTQLATIKPEGFVKMDMAKLGEMLRKEYPSDDEAREAAALEDMMAARFAGEENKRPSVEAILHALFPYRYVLHIHPALVNGLSCGRDGKLTCEALFGDRVVWIGLTKPGYILAKVCREAFNQRKGKTGEYPKISILMNHGIFVAADTVEEIDSLMLYVMETLKSKLKATPDFSEMEADTEKAGEIAPALRMLYSQEGKAVVTFCTNGQVMNISSDEKSFAEVKKPFTPDHIVYCKDEPLFVKDSADLKADFAEYVKRKGYNPKIAVVKGLGFFAVGATKKEAEIAKLLFLDAIKVAVYSASFGGAMHLTDEFTSFILNWEIEQYRSKAAFSGGAVKRLDGKIAVVTGSAQGFGKGIAEALAGEGAYVVIADLNGAGAKSCSEEINGCHDRYRSIAVAANVTDEDSVRMMINAAVLSYGGLDILVSNAGVLTAGGLGEMTKKSFEFVTSVNYTGYFLCSKYASVPMIIQREYSPSYMADIIEINSKSGLEGSNKNFAYAGSKFGGIGLTQSFALELVEYGIKVNAICPGNLLDGPLWSDPEKGLFKQYLDAGKVAGAKTIEDVRAFYEAKAPMKRGCTTLDVARAIFYIIEQEYETGQALPVTGGQVMLK